MNELQAQLQEVTDQLAQLDPNNRDNLVEIASLEQKRDLLKLQISDEAAKTEQDAAAQVKIESDKTDFTSFLDTLEIEGLTMRDLTVGENEYQMLRIAFENKLIEQSVKSASEAKLNNLAAADREGQLKRQNDLLQQELQRKGEESLVDGTKINELEQEVKDMRELYEASEKRVHQLEFEVSHAYSKIEAAVSKAEGLELLVSEKQAQIELLRTENAVGAVNAVQVIDQTDQIKALADKIKASRIHVYDVVPDADFNPKNFTAKRADTGEEVTYNWTQARNYIELKDAAEVERFRLEHAEQNAVPDTTLDTPIDVPTIPAVAEVTAPEVQFPDQGEVSTLPAPVASGISSENGSQAETVTRQEFEALRATVKELCEVCNIAEVA